MTREPSASKRAPVAFPKRVTSPPPVPKFSKDELRTHVEKLERTVATLRAKSRDAGRAAKVAAVRIEELEAQVAQLERAAAPKRAPAVGPESKAAKPTRGRRLSRERDPGGGVPPGVAVENPQPMDEEAEMAFKNLEKYSNKGET